MRYAAFKSWKNSILIFLIGLSLTVVAASAPRATGAAPPDKPGQRLCIASVPNLRDLGGYKTSDGKTVARGLVYRSNQLSGISPEDMKKLARLKLKNGGSLLDIYQGKLTDHFWAGVCWLAV